MAPRESTRSRRSRDDDDDDDDKPRSRRGRQEEDEEEESPRRGRRSRDDDDDDTDEKPARRGSRDSGGGKGVSWSPDDAQSSGLWAGGRARVKARYENFGYPDANGKDTRKPIPGLLVYYTPVDGEKDEEYRQFYSVGNDWKAAGAMLIPKAGQKGLPTNSNAMLYFFQPLVKALDAADIPLPDAPNGEVDVFDDMVVDVERKPVQERTFREGRRRGERRSSRDDDDRGQREGQQGKDILVPVEVIDAPWVEGKNSKKRRAKDEDEDEKPARGRGRSSKDDDDDDEKDEKPARGRGREAKANDEEIDEQAVEVIIEVLEQADDVLSIEDLEADLAKTLKGNKHAKAILARATDEELLEQEQGWSYNAKKGTVELAKRGRR